MLSQWVLLSVLHEFMSNQERDIWPTFTSRIVKQNSTHLSIQAVSSDQGEMQQYLTTAELTLHS